MKTSTLPVEGRSFVDGVETTAAMISGPVVSSCAKGLFTYRESKRVSWQNRKEPYIAILIQNDAILNFTFKLGGDAWRDREGIQPRDYQRAKLRVYLSDSQGSPMRPP